MKYTCHTVLELTFNNFKQGDTMARISAASLRYGLFRDLGIKVHDFEKLSSTKMVSHSTVSLFMQGKFGNKRHDNITKNKIYNYYASESKHPVDFEMFWGETKEFYEVITACENPTKYKKIN